MIALAHRHHPFEYPGTPQRPLGTCDRFGVTRRATWTHTSGLLRTRFNSRLSGAALSKPKEFGWEFQVVPPRRRENATGLGSFERGSWLICAFNLEFLASHGGNKFVEGDLSIFVLINVLEQLAQVLFGHLLAQVGHHHSDLVNCKAVHFAAIEDFEGLL